MGLTIKEVGTGNLHIFGPRAIDNVFQNATELFLHKNAIDLQYTTCTPGAVYESDGIRVVPFVLFPHGMEHVDHVRPDEAAEAAMWRDSDEKQEDKGGEDTKADQSKQSANPSGNSSEGSNPSRLPVITHRQELRSNNLRHAVCYEAYVKAPPGRINMQKVKELGVPVGSKLGVLKNGCEITLDDGRVIHPEDVVDAQADDFSFAVVDCPSGHYMKGLLKFMIGE